MPQLSTIKDYASNSITSMGVAALTAYSFGYAMGPLGGAIVVASSLAANLAIDAIEKTGLGSTADRLNPEENPLLRIANTVIRIFASYQLSAKLLAWQNLPALTFYSWMKFNIASGLIILAIAATAFNWSKEKQDSPPPPAQLSPVL